MTTLASIEREYTLQEIAIMTRAGAAKLIGLQNRGGLSAGIGQILRFTPTTLTVKKCLKNPITFSKMAKSW